jgi:hypothetical protein
MIRARLCVSVVAAIAAYGCSGDHGGAGHAGTSSSPTTVATERVVVRGHATLDGAPFDAEFLGAAVRDHGLVTPCQGTLPRVDGGLYVVEVMSDAVASGCGTPGSEILLWIFTGDTQYFSTAALPWPADGRPTTFDASFTNAAPKGAARPTTEFAGQVFEHEGRRLPDGTRVEAYVGTTLCGVASVRTNGDFTGFSLAVVGSESVAGCQNGATITFRVDGQQAITTAVNDFRSVPSLDLTLP